MTFEQELYNSFKYLTPRPYFHTFAGDVSLKKIMIIFGIYSHCQQIDVFF